MDADLKKLSGLNVEQNDCLCKQVLKNEIHERMTEWFKVSDCKSAGETCRRFESCFFQKTKYNVAW